MAVACRKIEARKIPAAHLVDPRAMDALSRRARGQADRMAPLFESNPLKPADHRAGRSAHRRSAAQAQARGQQCINAKRLDESGAKCTVGRARELTDASECQLRIFRLRTASLYNSAEHQPPLGGMHGRG